MENSASLVQQASNAEKAVTLLAELPTRKFMGHDMYLWEGSWFPRMCIEPCLDLQSNFNARDDDIFLASPMKCGTTWLKALVSSIVHDYKEDDPLVSKNPHDIVPSLELSVHFCKTIDESSKHSFTRVFHSHFPFHSLPDSIKNSSCKVIFLARNPKDTCVSMYHFLNTLRTPEQGPFPLNQMFESFCDGVQSFGPYLDHVLEYWNESLKNPKRVLFLKYEDLQREQKENSKKIAEFLGKPFRNDQEVDQVIWRCSFERLKNLEVKSNGSLEILPGWKCNSFFRRVVGDSKNYLLEKMAERLDGITRSKLLGSGLDFDL